MTTEKPFEGPVQQWTPNAENAAAIENMLASEDKLTRAYGEAYQNGCWIRELGTGSDNPESGITAVGDLSKLGEVQFRIGKELDINEFGLGDCVNLGAFPGSGETRAERVRNGMQQVIEAREQSQDSEALDLYGSFVESGYKVDAYMPKSAAQARQWTVRIYKEGEDAVFREVTIPMDYEPIFGVDVSDKYMLEKRTEEIMRELTA